MKKFYSPSSKKIILILAFLCIFLIYCNVKIKNSYNRAIIDSYYLTIHSMESIDYGDIRNNEDIKQLYKKIIDIYKHTSALSIHIKNSNLVLRKDKNIFNHIILKLNKNLHNFIKYHNYIFARGNSISPAKLSNYNSLKSELIRLANEFNSKGSTEYNVFGVRQYILQYDNKYMDTLEERVNAIEGIIHNLTDI